MTATSLERDTPRAISGYRTFPIKGSTKVLKGTLCVLDAGVAKGGATATDLVCIGRAKQTYDNTSGSDGDLNGDFEYGEFRWANGDSIDEGDYGKIAWVTDNQTVTVDSTGKSPAGMITRVDSSGVWVSTPEDIGSITGLAATSATLATATPAAVGDPAAGSASTASKSDHVHAITALSVAYQHPGDSAASDTLAEHVVHMALGKSIKVLAAKIESDAGLTSNDTTYATITIKQGDGAGGARSSVCSVTTKTSGGGGTGNWTAFTVVDMGTITNATVPLSGIVTVTIAKASTGVQLPAFRLSLSVTTDL
jgi:hypothetical protein